MQGAVQPETQTTTGGQFSGQRYSGGQRLSAGEAAVDAFKDYARERPEVVTMWAFGIGFVLGWKLRIW